MLYFQVHGFFSLISPFFCKVHPIIFSFQLLYFAVPVLVFVFLFIFYIFDMVFLVFKFVSNMFAVTLSILIIPVLKSLLEEFQHMCHLNVCVCWLSFHTQVEIFMVLGMVGDFQLYPGQFEHYVMNLWILFKFFVLVDFRWYLSSRTNGCPLLLPDGHGTPGSPLSLHWYSVFGEEAIFLLLGRHGI